jgi:hypothetical protein
MGGTFEGLQHALHTAGIVFIDGLICVIHALAPGSTAMGSFRLRQKILVLKLRQGPRAVFGKGGTMKAILRH